MTATLTVPLPTLAYDDVGGGAAALEKPVTVLIGAVTQTGTPLAPPSLASFGLILRRRASAGAQLEIWDDAAKAWVVEQPAAAPKPVAIAYKGSDPNPWQGMIVAAGMKDGTGAPAFAKAAAGYPQYTVGGAFTAKDGARGSGPQTGPFTFAGVADRNLVALGAGDGEQVDSATQARLLLKDTPSHVIGGVTVLRDAPSATVRVENASGASVVLHADGSIEITPATGRGVRIAGDLETEHIRYQPAGGGLKKDLV